MGQKIMRCGFNQMTQKENGKHCGAKGASHSDVAKVYELAWCACW